jgi:hypothetical protein
MKLTIIKPDQVVIKDNRPIAPIDMTGMEEEVRVVQWDEDTGHEELEDGTNVLLHDISKYQFMVDRFDEAAYIIDNPPPPTQAEIEEMNAKHALALRNDFMAKLRENDLLKNHGIPPILSDEEVVEVEQQIRMMQTVAEYPPNTEYNFPNPIEPGIPQPTSTSIMLHYDDDDTNLTGTAFTYPDGFDPATMTMQIYDAMVDGNLIVSDGFEDDGDGTFVASVDLDLSAYDMVFITVNDSFFRMPVFGNLDQLYLYH